MAQRQTNIWNQIPLFRALWPLAGGIIIGVFMPDLLSGIIALSISFLLLLIYLVFRSEVYLSVAAMLSFIFLGFAITSFQTERLTSNHYSTRYNGDEAKFIGRIVSDPIIKTRSIKSEFLLEFIVKDIDTAAVSGKIMLYFEKDSESLKTGYDDQLLLVGSLKQIPPPQNPDQFNYKRYMHFHQISDQLYAKSGRWVMISQGKDMTRYVIQLQHKIIKTLEGMGINDSELAIVSALLIGYKHYLSADQVNAFASAGAMHVLAVSGLHVGIIFLILNTLFKPIDKWPKTRLLKTIILFISLWGYASLTGLSPSVTRAATMFSFVVVAQQLKRHTDIFNSIAASAVLLLVLNPYLIMEVGFQLSYIAVLGIVIIQPRIYEIWQPRWWILDKIWGITTVSIAAQLATFPLGLLYFHQFPNYFLLSNLVVIPAAMLIIPSGIAALFFSWIPLVGTLLAKMLYWLVHGLDLFMRWVEHLPFALIQGIDISIFETYLIYMLVFTVIAFLVQHKIQWLIYFLITACVIEGLNINETWVQRHQKELVFYKVKGHSAVDFISGNNHVLIADTGLTNDFDKMRFHIHHHWWKRDLAEPKPDIDGILKSRGTYVFNGIVLMCPGDSVQVSAINDAVDYLLIDQRTIQSANELIDKIKPRLVILGNNLNWKSSNYWVRSCIDRNIEFWDIKDKGALSVGFD